ncbi:Disease resistance protein RPM1 [Acorus calamus]|uniref:Disease resistance protein RPM1 n=1 Tax=Acorus calamus TaxID=4465 RepID=A0AAV9E971_ACOCL|nr:Disease resistance protein RPM1 [Acorus calamus]
MAEGIVGSLILQIASSFTSEADKSLWSCCVEEASMLASVKDDMEDINNELKMIQAVLRKIDPFIADDAPAAVWMEEVRNAAYDIEDIIDEFTYFLTGERHRGFLSKTIHLPKNIYARHGVARRMKKIKGTIKEISERRKRYDFWVSEQGSSSSDTKNRPEDITPFFQNDIDVVGMNDEKEGLISWLTDENVKRMEISVCGMGGVGKTTLVAQVYKSEQIVNDFQWRAWVTISKTYNKDDVLRQIIKELLHEKKDVTPQDIDGMDLRRLDLRRLAEKLREILENKRYLIVLDDVWDDKLWSAIHHVFPDNTSKRRIIFTTRDGEIASSLASSNHVLNIQPLKPERAWELFCSIAFRGYPERMCPQELCDSAKAIVDRCDGLPLAIVTLGGLLYSKHSVEEWGSILKSLNDLLNNDDSVRERVSNILMFSFHDLPYYLKNCFLYCSVFPEDYLIGRKRITRLWIAEGFVEVKEEKTMEEVADEYLHKLILKNMLIVAGTNTWGRLRTCRMHDVVREVAISISKNQNFFMRLETRSPSDKSRRLSIDRVNNTNGMAPLGKMTHLRSLLVFTTRISDQKHFNINETLRFRLLRVLDLQGAHIEGKLDVVGDLINLRFLSLRYTDVSVLPKSFKKLHNLQTLDFAYSKVDELPSWVSKLPSLRHLLIFQSRWTSKKGPGDIWVSKELQTLKCINSNSEVVRQVGYLTQLRTFEIGEVRDSDGIELCASIKKMRFLHKLSVLGEGPLELRPLGLETLDPPPLLQKLNLSGRLQRLPRGLSSLANLRELSLISSKLSEDPLPFLKSLPNLVCLVLSHDAYDGEELCFQVNAFPSLKVLSLDRLSQLSQITIEERTMQSLKELILTYCSELKRLPQGIEHLTTLQELRMSRMSEELLERMRGQGVDFQKISHIPKVHHARYNINGERKVEMLS